MNTSPLGLLYAVLMLTTCALRSAAGAAYANITMYPGDNLICNPLPQGDNRLNTILTAAPDLSMLSLWDPISQQFSTPSIYSQESGWSLNYYLPPGAGALFNVSSANATTVTFVGGVDFSTPPEHGAGTFLLSSITPYLTASFLQVVGRDPMEGESVRRLDAASQTYTVSTFLGESWDNGIPDLAIGHSAFYTLVPEPGTFGLVAMGLMILIAARWAGSARPRRGE